jgi:ectoine hydroxylase-related dioxygenase (phytanoyl-CoA dioxygenase family)
MSKKSQKINKKAESRRLAKEKRAAKRSQKNIINVGEPYIAQLEKIVSREEDAISTLLQPKIWEQHLCGNHMLANIDESNEDVNGVIFDKALHQIVAKQLHMRGCTVAENSFVSSHSNSLLPPRPAFSWGSDYQKILQNIDASMESLKNAGWPPVFVYLFDEPWLLIDRLFELVAPILGEDCLLEASMYGWSLSREAEAAEVGGNFSLPHRDNSFADCNFSDGKPSHLSAWMCVNDVGLDNGCMHVLPKDSDCRFHMNDDYWHERVAYLASEVPELRNASSKRNKLPKEQVVLNFPLQHAIPMPAPRGSVLLWQPNCIHWGSSCSPSTHLPPRKSLAMSFRVSGKKRKIEKYERDLMTRDEVRNMKIEDRLVRIAESILMYSKWFPSFQAFDLGLLKTGMLPCNPETDIHSVAVEHSNNETKRIEEAEK